MSPNLFRHLHMSYPQLLARDGLPTELRVRNGWFTLLDDLLFLLDAHRKSALPLLRVVEVKQKYGALRIYTTVADDTVRHLLDAFEMLSTRRCERCGVRGQRGSIGGGVFVLCDEHASTHPRQWRDD